MKLLLLCNAGMSTGLMQMKLQEEAEKRGLDAEILAIPMVELEEQEEAADIVLLGPQIRFAEEEVRGKLPHTPVMVISSVDFGTMNAKHVMDAALRNIAEK